MPSSLIRSMDKSDQEESFRRSTLGSPNSSIPKLFNDEVTSKQKPFQSNSTFLDKLRDPINRLDSILQDIIDYKLDATTAGATCAKLMQTLERRSSVGSDDQLQTVSFAHKIAGNQASRYGLVSCHELIFELVHILQTTKSAKLQSETARTLQLMAKSMTGTRLISERLTISVLVKMLKHPSAFIFNTAVYLLNQCMWHWPDHARPQVRNHEGHVGIASLLVEGKVSDPEWIVICAEALRMAVYRDAPSKLNLLDTNIYNDLVRLLRTYVNNSKVAYNIARLIKVLSTCNANKAKLVEYGTVEALGSLINTGNTYLQLEALWGLRNLSDHAFRLNMDRSVIGRLIDLLASTDENISICAAGCLCNLTCWNATNKELVVEMGGVSNLCQLFVLNSQRTEIAEPICSALRHVTHRSPHAGAAIFEIQNNETIPSLVSILEQNTDPSSLPLIKAVVGLIRNLATDQDALTEMKLQGVTRAMAGILKGSHRIAESLKRSTAPQDVVDPENEVNGVQQSVDMGCIEGVQLEDMIELCIISLYTMAKDVDVQNDLIHIVGIITLMVQLLYCSSVAIQGASVALLSQLALSRLGVKAIEHEGACSRLTELIQSNNEHIAAYSAATLHRITQDKPADYRERLSAELRQSLFDGGLALDDETASGSVVPRSDVTMSYVDEIGSRSARGQLQNANDNRQY